MGPRAIDHLAYKGRAMKRFVSILAAFVILVTGLAMPAAAQDTSEPSEESVLEIARQKYFQDMDEGDEEASDESVLDDEDYGEGSDSDRRERAEREVPFVPLVLSFAPGLSAPFGLYDAAIAAGAIGVISRDIYGLQAAGVLGIARNVAGFQGAGVFSLATGDVRGFQGAGVFSLAEGRVDGCQWSGVFNIAEGGIAGVQGAGVFNIAEDAQSPFQAAGVFNIAENIDGVQLAGVFNAAEDVDGGQIAAIVNVADDVEGFQIGLVNIADRLDGIQLGLINIAKEPGLSSNGAYYEPESEYVYAAFQAGSRGIYSLISAGIPRNDWNSSADGLVLGYGLGTRIRLPSLYLDVDASAVSLVGPDLGAIGSAIEACEPLADASGLVPFPSIRAYIGIPLVGRLHLVAGFKSDIDLEVAPMVPEALRRGATFDSSLFDIDYRAWTKWYLGVKL